MKGVILAATASGSGKTIITLALLRYLSRRGVDVCGAKTGPDYIDPGFHAAATGRSSINLDPWAMRQSTILALIRHMDAELCVCEGVMGLFDGAGRTGHLGSTGDLAALTSWPVVLIVDAHGQSASVGALLQGFARFRSDVPLAGVIFNRVGSTRHAEILKHAAKGALPDLPVLGAIPRDAALELPSRHLGLILAEETAELDRVLDHAADTIAQTVDVDRLTALAHPNHRMVEPRHRPMRPLGEVIAVARDSAFAFVYPHLIDGWRAAGSSILMFSPLRNEGPDPDCDAVFLPGGYPELHAERLAAADRFLKGLKTAADGGAVIYGECGGYMVLGRTLIDGTGRPHRMAGLLPVVTSMAKPVRRLGYRQAKGIGGVWKDLACRGHEFHFAEIVDEGNGAPLWSLHDADGEDLGRAGHVIGNVSGSFFHLIDQTEAA